MAEFIAFVTSGIVPQLLLIYLLVFWIALVFWTSLDIFKRSGNWFLRFGSVLLVGMGFVFGFALYVIVRPQTTMEEEKAREFEEKLLENQSRSFLCPKCASLVREDFLFCADCGTQVKRECESCKRFLEIVWLQCPYCGVPTGVVTLPAIKEVPALPTKSNPVVSLLKKIFSSPKEPVEVKRGRGRPRKYPVPTGEIVKRPRGRPRKYNVAYASTASKRSSK